MEHKNERRDKWKGLIEKTNDSDEWKKLMEEMTGDSW